MHQTSTPVQYSTFRVVAPASRILDGRPERRGGAGVSRCRAGLPDFLKLGGDVVDLLGAGEKILARKLFRRIKELEARETLADPRLSETHAAEAAKLMVDFIERNK